MSYRETLSLQTLSNRLHKPLLRIASAAVSCAFLVIVSVRLIDRPVATWVHEHLGDARFAWLRLYRDGHLLPVGPFSFMAGPAEAIGPLALLALVLLALAATAGWRPIGHWRSVLALCLSVVVTLPVNHEIKSVFGRTWPESWLGDNPSWIRDGVFEFSPFHGSALASVARAANSVGYNSCHGCRRADRRKLSFRIRYNRRSLSWGRNRPWERRTNAFDECWLREVSHSKAITG
jgi:hypothetical protein